MDGSFGARLRKARDYRMLSQSELAAKAGLNREHVADMERGRAGKRPWPKTVRQLAEALAINPYWLRDGDGEMLAGAPPRDPVE